MAQPLRSRDAARIDDLKARLEKTRAAMLRAHERAQTALARAIELGTDLTGVRRLQLLNAAHIESQRAKEAAEQLVHAKDRYIAVFSHEVRQAVQGCLTAVALCRVRTEPAAVHRACDVMERQLRRIARLLDDVVETARGTLDRLKLEPSRVSLAEVIESAVATAKPRIDERRHQLQVLTCGNPLWVTGDAVRLEQVFSNLLINAADYTPDGGSIVVSCEVDGAAVVTRIRDTGRGLTPEEIATLFQPFTKSAGSRGLGVGLALAATIVSLHGGSIAADSEGRDRGSTFIVRLPSAM